MTGFQLTDCINRSPELALVNVGAAAKRSSAAAQDRDVRLGVGIERSERGHQLAHNLVADGIQFLRPVHRDSDDGTVAFIVDVLPFLGHSSSP